MVDLCVAHHIQVIRNTNLVDRQANMIFCKTYPIFSHMNKVLQKSAYCCVKCTEIMVKFLRTFWETTISPTFILRNHNFSHPQFEKPQFQPPSFWETTIPPTLIYMPVTLVYFSSHHSNELIYTPCASRYYADVSTTSTIFHNLLQRFPSALCHFEVSHCSN